VAARTDPAVQAIKAQFSALKRRKRFVDWREVRALADELTELLADIKRTVADPQSGVELTAAFFQLEESVFVRVDDSNGEIGDVFRNEATDLLVHYALQHGDKAWLRHVTLGLLRANDYGACDGVMSVSKRYLGEVELRALADELWEEAAAADKSRRFHLLTPVMELARQLLDPEFFQLAVVANFGKLGASSYLDLARICFERDELDEAQAWLAQAERDGKSFQEEERDAFRLKLYRRLGQIAELQATAWRIFRRRRTKASLDILLDAVGAELRATVLTQEAALLITSPDFSAEDVKFLADMRLIAEAAQYVLIKRDRIDGGRYDILRPLAKKLTAAGHLVAAAALYRSFVEAVLATVNSRYYPYAVRDVNALRKLAREVQEWQPLASHEDYMRQLYENHKRKYAFWNQCGNW
jgi:hypothetical protein